MQVAFPIIIATVILLSFPGNSSTGEDFEDKFHCQIIYNGFSTFGVVNYELSATLTTNPVEPENQYCVVKRSKEWLENGIEDQVKISCDRQFKAFLNSELVWEVGRVFWAKLNCSANFTLDIFVDKHLTIEELKFDFGNVGNTTYWAVVDFPESKNILEKSVFSGNYTFYSKADPNVNISVDFGIQVINDSPSSTVKFEPVRTDLIFHTNYLQCNSNVIGIGTPYLATVAGKNPKHTELLYDCLDEDKICKGKIIGTGKNTCDFTVNGCMLTENFNSQGAALCVINDQKVFKPYFTSINGYEVISNASAFWDQKNIIELHKDDSKEEVIVGNKSTSEPVPVLYENETIMLECKFLDYFLKPPLTWSAMYSNHTEILISMEEYPASFTTEKKIFLKPENFIHRTKELVVKSSNKKITAIFGMIAVRCSAPFWNSSDFYASATLALNVRSLSETSPPVFTTPETNRTAVLGSPMNLTCTTENAIPVPEYHWEYPPALLNATIAEASLNITASPDHRSSILMVYSVNRRHQGEFICTAMNFRGVARRKFLVNTTSDSIRIYETGKYTYAGILIVVITVLVIALVVLARMYHLQRGRLTAAEIKLFQYGDAKALVLNKSVQENAQYLPYDKAYEVKWDEFHISDEELGEGEYGKVFKGYLKKDPDTFVAIKTVRPGVDKEGIWALLSELKIMIYLGKHDNLIELIGACTEFLREGRVYVIIEFCPMGSLEEYLHEYRVLFAKPEESPVASSSNAGSSYVSFAEVIPEEQKIFRFNTEVLINWSTQVALGMKYLTEKKVIHGDLATRNVLMVSKQQIKISDFGLSCKLRKYETYVKQLEAKIPWRWLPPETLKTYAFTHKTDVWSYGVLLWEIFSLGDVPYAGFSWSHNFSDYLVNNLRLLQPAAAPDKIYKIMAQCWSTEPEKRPDFIQVEQFLINSTTEEVQLGVYV